MSLHLLPAGPVLILADPKVPEADSLLVYGWRRESLDSLCAGHAIRPTKATRQHTPPAPFMAVVPRRAISRALNAHLLAQREPTFGGSASSLAADDIYAAVVHDVMALIRSLNWELPAPLPAVLPPELSPDAPCAA
jgi:hypothetical protein